MQKQATCTCSMYGHRVPEEIFVEVDGRLRSAISDEVHTFGKALLVIDTADNAGYLNAVVYPVPLGLTDLASQ